MESPSRTEAELRTRVGQQEAVAELGQRALETDDVDQLIREASTALTENLGIDCCAAIELLPNGDEGSLRGGVGWRPGLIGDATVPTGRDSQAGRALHSGEPVIVDGLESDERGIGCELFTDHGIESGITVVVGSTENPWGVLGAYSSDGGTFTERDANFVQSIANVLATTIDRSGTERRLRERETRLERYAEYTDDVLDAIGDLFYVVDEAGNFRRWNDALNEVTGRSDAEIESMDPVEFVAEADRETIVEGMAEVFETGSARVEAEIVTADGERIPYEFAAARLEDLDGKRLLAGIGRDVSDRRDRERELAKYEAIVETMNDGIYVKDESGRFTMVNEAYARLTGYDREELVGEHASLVVDEETIQQSKRQLQDSGGDSAVEAELQRPDGSTVPVEGTFATLEPDGGEREEIGVVRDVTERKRREREHRRIVRALEAAREGVSLLDENGEFIYVNDAYAETFGYEREAMLGEHWDDLGIEADPSRLYDEILPRLDDEGQWSGTTTCVRSDGSTFCSQHSLTQTEDGELICLVRDITEQRERERDLQETRARLDVATEAASVGLWTWDVRDGVVTADEFLAAAYGVDPETAADGAPMERFYESIHEDDRERTRERFRQALEEGSLEAEYRVRDANGDVMWVVARGEVEYDADGEPLRMTGAVSDITERKRRERQLEESERRYRTLAENFPNGAVGVYDDDLRFTLIEGAVLGDVLPSADRLAGETVSEFFPDEASETLESLFRTALEEGETDSITIDVADRHWRVWAAPLCDANGEIFAGLSFAQDITEQVERERRLEELVERLEVSNERLEHFAYAASHDLQEPLRMVSSYLQLLEHRYGDDLNEEAREFLAFAVDGADRMREMVDGLLEYSRVETRGDPFEPIDLNDVVEDVLADLQVKIEESDADISVAELPRVEGDGGQLRQLFQNLLDNAIEYSGDDPPRIRVTADRRSRTDDVWTISVSDEGIGIDPDDADRIFEIFQRLHARDEHDGTGIGLALCERIVERHGVRASEVSSSSAGSQSESAGGEIWVESEPGEGSTFSFTLPAADGDSQ